MNVYGNGGFELIQNVENLNSELFLNTSKEIISAVNKYSTTGSDVFAGAAYVFADPLLPLLDNSIEAVALTET